MDKLTIYPSVSLEVRETRNPFFTEIRKRVYEMQKGECIKVALPIDSETKVSVLQKRMGVIVHVYSKKIENTEKKKFSVRIIDDSSVGIFRIL